MRAALSSIRRSLISLSWVLVWACRCHRLKRLPSICYLAYTPSYPFWAMGAALSSIRRSLISLSWVLVWACRCHRLKRLSSICYLAYTPSSSFGLSDDYFRIMLKHMLNFFGARTQPGFTLLVMGKGSDRSPLSVIWHRLFWCSWMTICRKLGDSQVVSG